MGLLRYAVFAFAFTLSACAGVAPVPGGSDSVNAAYYKTADEFQYKIASLQPGMPQEHVFLVLGRTPGELKQLSRDEILTALYGRNTTQSLGVGSERDTMIAYIQSLYGYQMRYKDVSKDHGFVNPFRLRTNEDGFDYTVNLVFREGLLLEKPDLSGGVVHERSSSTLWDYLNPGTVLGRM